MICGRFRGSRGCITDNMKSYLHTESRSENITKHRDATHHVTSEAERVSPLWCYEHLPGANELQRVQFAIARLNY